MKLYFLLIRCERLCDVTKVLVRNLGEIMLLIQIIKIQNTISVLASDQELQYTIIACNSHSRFLTFWMIFIDLGNEIDCCQVLCVVLLYVIL